ncbi:MAG TPA: substrate-binding domain-containing protein [Terrimicrobiaceae bacterium]|nr:substrate-binding domain-containing protein [Terrimicrobiaceae bacterium]
MKTEEGISQTRRPLSIGEIVAATGLSRATIDRIINKRPGVHRRTQEYVLRVMDGFEQGTPASRQEPVGSRETRHFELVIQAGEAFTETLLEATEHVSKAEPGRATLRAVASHSDEETVELIRSLGKSSDGLALVSKDIEPIRASLSHLQAAGKPVAALVSDLETAARSAYVGIDDRAAGQSAGFLLGRCLERVPRAEVAVIVGIASYRCHEDREMGFRTLLRQRFPQIELVEAIRGDESHEATYEAALRLLRKHPGISGIYNVTGGNDSLAQAIAHSDLSRRPLLVAHEVNRITTPLLKAGVIDFLITQGAETLIQKTRQILIELCSAGSSVRELNHVPFHVVTEFNLESGAGHPHA